MRKWLVRAAGLGVLVAGALGGLLALGHATREGVRDLDRYTVRFADTDCAAPPGMTRADFLAEIQYLAGLPDRLPILDGDLPRRLAAAFADHPWVESVERVEVTPERRVRARLRFRHPALAVSWLDGRGAVQTRVVDATGVLLPQSAETAGLPLWNAGNRGPDRPAGRAWGRPAIESAARTAAFLALDQPRLRIESVAEDAGNLILYSSSRARVLWGRAPGGERDGEAPAAEKRARLVAYCREHGDLGRPAGPYEHDVRPKTGPLRRSLNSVAEP